MIGSPVVLDMGPLNHIGHYSSENQVNLSNFKIKS